MKIRGHHLLCLQGFRGLGYSNDFIQKMKKIKRILENRQHTKIKIVNQTDTICKACPHQSFNRCEFSAQSNNNIIKMDNMVLELLGIKPNTELSYLEVLKLLSIKIKKEDLFEICSNCQWLSLGYCIEGISTISTKLST